MEVRRLQLIKLKLIILLIWKTLKFKMIKKAIPLGNLINLNHITDLRKKLSQKL